MIDGLAARFFIKQKQILTHIHIICLFFPFVFFQALLGNRGKNLALGLCRCNVPDMVSSYNKLPLKLMRFSARHKYLCAFSINCRTYEDERGVSYVSYRQNIEVMLVWPVIM